ncbi:MAG TPA: hypothetical protein VE090_05855 [Methylomirabilota bacterium]|nr:hypothetical protein [Methylomirabilota bacterium]
MDDFVFRKHPDTGSWVILAPRRSQRTNAGKIVSDICPFCIGREAEEEELYRVGGKTGDSNWQIRVIPNKFPFTPHHEIIIHSPDHHKNIDELPFSQVVLLLETYRQRFLANRQKGQVYIFHNHAHASGESLSHPHTQVTVLPDFVHLSIPLLDKHIYKKQSWFGKKEQDDVLETDKFLVFCPKNSDWPDEVWIAPKKHHGQFGDITDPDITDMAFVLSRLIQLFDLRHGFEFPFNFYIYPGNKWYLRLIPRLKILGGFELGTQVIVNTQDPSETFAFIKEHFWQPDREKIKQEHQAEYLKTV